MNSLKNKNVLITGASRGLGLAFAEAAGRVGAKVVLVARHGEALNREVKRLESLGIKAWGIEGDVSHKEDIYKITGEAAALAGPIDILVNNASELGPVPLKILMDTECEDFEQVLQTNLLGPFRLIKSVAGSMLLRDEGAIINISSDAAAIPYPRWGIYGASKAALDYLTKIFAEEHFDSKVKFLSFDPGEMNTKMHADAVPDADPKSLRDPKEVAQILVDLLSHPDDWKTGGRMVAGDWKVRNETRSYAAV